MTYVNGTLRFSSGTLFRLRAFSFRAAATSLLGFLLILEAQPAFSASPEFLGQSRDWGTYRAQVDGGKTCYAVTRPQDQHPKNVRRGPVYFFVATRPKEGIRNQVSIEIGYPFNEKAPASVEVDGQKFSLFTKGEKAWVVDDSGQQKRLIAAIQSGKKMIVRGRSRRGTDTKDLYSLMGSSAAIKKALQACR